VETNLLEKTGAAGCSSPEAHLLAQLNRGCQLAHLARVTINPDSRRDAAAAAIAIYENSVDRLPDLKFTEEQRGALDRRLKLLKADLLVTCDWAFLVRSLFEH
jgi:hypothetical protein